MDNPQQAAQDEINKRRDAFLLDMYDKLWDSIDRAERGLWQFVALYAVVIGLTIGALQNVATQLVAVVAGLIISFWGMNVTIETGKWFNRNRLFVVNIEKVFLLPDDIGRLFPRAYHDRARRGLVLTEIYRIHFIVFAVTAAGITSFYVYSQWPSPCWIVLVPTVLSCVAYTIHRHRKATKEVSDFIANTSPGAQA
jgi:hypothetical protein